MITTSFEDFVSHYHNSYQCNISCIVFNNINHTGLTKDYIYNDKRIDTIVTYYGQKKGRMDKYIKENETIYVEKSKNQNEYTYIGIVESFTIQKMNGINLFKLTLNMNHIQNGRKSGDKLSYIEGIDRGKGSYCYKKSSMLHLGFQPTGNLCSGIVKLK